MSDPDLIGGAALQEVYDTFVKAILGPGLPAHMRQLARWALVRIGAYEAAEKLCDFAGFGEWAMGAEFPIFLQQLPRVRTREDRVALLEQHRRWAANLEQKLDRSAVVLPTVRTPGKLRIGLISTGFHQIVGRYCLPLFEHKTEDCELFAYSVGVDEGGAGLERMAALSTFRSLPAKLALDAARIIAADELDLLIELDGLSGAHALKIMAHKPARKQASCLGYPHSTGLSTIDYIVLDPQLDSSLVLEKPILLPRTWICLPTSSFHDDHVIDPRTPEARRGFLTFGTLNNPYKFNLETIRSWARVVVACPGSKFLFARPEADAPSFRRGMAKRFLAEGVTEDRLLFDGSRGRHMSLYNDIDISLDPFPLTGGTTTAESLWMGVPVVTLVGEAPFERMSYSLLVNADLAELAATTVEDYEATAIAMARAPERRADLRAHLRQRIRATPLGDAEQFAANFYAAMAKAAAEK